MSFSLFGLERAAAITSLPATESHVLTAEHDRADDHERGEDVSLC